MTASRHATLALGVVGLAVLTGAGCSGDREDTRIRSTDFVAGSTVGLDLTDATGTVLVDVGYAFDVGNLVPDYLPGDVDCRITGSFASIEPRDRGGSYSDDLDDPFSPIGVWLVGPGIGEITCDHFLGEQVGLRVDLWAP